jgi:hypothetical protein
MVREYQKRAAELCWSITPHSQRLTDSATADD